MPKNKYNSWLYENKLNLVKYIEIQPEYSIDYNKNIYFNNILVGKVMNHNDLFQFIYEQTGSHDVEISNKFFPRDTLYVLIYGKITIIDYRYQQVAGSVDEKLQTCDFKKKQYKKLLSTLNIEVEYIYILNDWFRKPEYKDVLDYIHSVGCDYYFNYIPLIRLGLPVPK